jgi:hypothetical protein
MWPNRVSAPQSLYGRSADWSTGSGTPSASADLQSEGQNVHKPNPQSQTLRVRMDMTRRNDVTHRFPFEPLPAEPARPLTMVQRHRHTKDKAFVYATCKARCCLQDSLARHSRTDKLWEQTVKNHKRMLIRRTNEKTKQKGNVRTSFNDDYVCDYSWILVWKVWFEHELAMQTSSKYRRTAMAGEV